MKLLIITQKADINDPILGFFHRWIEEFSRNFEAVTVICLEEGRHELPANVKVLSLGKEKAPKSKATGRFLYTVRFFRHIWRERKNYDAVFVHMNPIYAVGGGWFWKMSGKKIALWYTHRAVDVKLRVAEKFADVIFTASAEGLTLKTAKKRVVGHGIDVERYTSARHASEARMKRLGTEPISIISVGRITPIKNCDTLVEAARVLKEKYGARFTVTFIGSSVTAGDRGYSAKVKSLVEKYALGSIVSFAGDMKPVDMPAAYASADISINLTPTGGLDKAVLESMAAGVPVLTSNAAFKSYFESASAGLADKLIFRERDAKDLAEKIAALFGPTLRKDNLRDIGLALQKTVREKADVGVLIDKISESIKNI